MPDTDSQERTPYRKYLREPDSTFVSGTSTDGVRYVPELEDRGTIGVYDHFVDSSGGVVLLHVGDMRGANNVRRAYSPPGNNGWTFRFESGNILGDADPGGGPNSYVDQ